jgi:hypothetical protein
MHYKRWRNNGDPAVVARQATYRDAICSIAGCGRTARRNGMCDPHSKRVMANGDADATVPIRPHRNDLTPYERVMAASHDDPSGCRLFVGAKNSEGYGQVAAGRNRKMYAHRAVLEHHLGPSDLFALHSCDTPACVNIDHLRYGTATENVADMRRRGRAWWQQP